MQHTRMNIQKQTCVYLKLVIFATDSCPLSNSLSLAKAHTFMYINTELTLVYCKYQDMTILKVNVKFMLPLPL